MPKSEATVEWSEADRIFDWRAECLQGEGVQPEVAAVLAASSSDLHKMIASKRQGCSDKLLLKIYG